MSVDLDKIVKKAEQSGYIEACHDINMLAHAQVTACTEEDTQAAGAILAIMKVVLALSKMKLKEVNRDSDTEEG